MTETRDAVARAIYEGRNGKGRTPWSRLPASHKEPYLKDADAATRAMLSACESAQIAAPGAAAEAVL